MTTALVEPRLRPDPARPNYATIDDKTVIRRPRRCCSCSRPITAVEQVQHTEIGEDPKKYDAQNLPTFPGPETKCHACSFDGLLMGEAWSNGGPTHATVREAIAATEGATRPGELQLRAELESQLAGLGDDSGHLFPVGTIRIGKITLGHGVGHAQIKPFLDRHVRGDHGDFGPQPAEISPEADWWPALADVATANAIAVRDRFGFVRSAYGPFLHLCPAQQREVASRVRLITFIDRNSASTLAIAEGRSSVAL